MLLFYEAFSMMNSDVQFINLSQLYFFLLIEFTNEKKYLIFFSKNSFYFYFSFGINFYA